MGLLDLLGFGNKNEMIQEFVAKGAIILDVRTPEEFAGGHIPNSRNIPLQRIASEITTIKKWNKPVITCCRSGMRSAQAATVLKQNNIEVINGGGWNSLESKL
ncbi:rhodanese-like domain-containing protein [Flavobacterium supellecticarium]|uniref:Rhodanese-like domain-containing protein n=1 Tax=Flavobacterium supellecticarium TaxID=2565924 RepID=A0A4S3ZZ99_9FLAO|nr:rhodanese-like domain-containing protein [Flavobacterium supellecticarium]THF51285.1 rhodanese-like domain-containing protein [Flavobacterium supellecticarium]